MAHRGGHRRRPGGRGAGGRTACPVAGAVARRLRRPARLVHALLPTRDIDRRERRPDDPPQSLRASLKRAKAPPRASPGVGHAFSPAVLWICARRSSLAFAAPSPYHPLVPMPLPSDPSPARVVSPEARRRRREGWIIFATALAVVAFAIFDILSRNGVEILVSNCLLRSQSSSKRGPIFSTCPFRRESFSLEASRGGRSRRTGSASTSGPRAAPSPPCPRGGPKGSP